MECNRDDALRATEVAEKKLAVRDLAAAKKFALKAMHLFPGLDRAKQMLLVVEVHAAAESKCDDWYGILQVDPVADFDSIKKQFRKLALQLHPDKNNLQGAEQAFKLINQAWGVLSDQIQRAVYDVKRSAASESNGCNHASAASADAVKVPQQQQPSAGRQQESAPPASGRQQPPAQPPRQGPLSSKGGPSAATSSSQVPTSSTQAQDTFWTQCPRCRVQYQYYRRYENIQLLCQRCKEGFVAKDMHTPALARGKDKQQQQSDAPRGSRVKNRVNGVKSGDVVQLMQQKAREREEKRLEDERRKMEREKEREEKRRLKEVVRKFKEEERRREALERQMQKQREREEKEARKKTMEALKRKLKRSRMQEEDDDDDEDDEEDEEEEEVAAAQAAALGLRRSYRTRKNVVYRDDVFDEDGQAAKKARTEELYLSEEELAFRKDLAEKGRQYVLKALSVMLQNNKSGQKQKAAAAEVLKEEQGVQDTQKEPVAEAMMKTAPAAVKTPSECVQNQNCGEMTSSDDSQSDAVFFVPDSDFYDFDKDRREEDVQDRQIWALYDDADGMPRFYCEIKQVVSRTPFKLRIRWLEQHQPSEVEQKWQEAGFQLTCGRFKLAKRAKPEDQINKFSHAMMASKIQGNVVRVYPVKGEVWALYRGWSAEWLEQGINAEAASRGGYEMVEVVGDGSCAAAASPGAAEVAEEETFVTVVNLVKVDGFRTIFARGQGVERTFKRQELLRFSHRVPAHWMTGEEKPNAPKDCWQLDTAAMPSHLINEAGH